MIALMDTPKLQQTIRSTASRLLDSKEFDSKNLSTQAKAAVKNWAKDVLKSEFIHQIEGQFHLQYLQANNKILESPAAVVDAIKTELLKVIPTPASLSFDLFVTKKTLNEALKLLQQQLKNVLDKDEIVQSIYSFAVVDTIFVEPDAAGNMVLDLLAVWSRISGQEELKIKAAATDLINFGKHKGMLYFGQP